MAVDHGGGANRRICLASDFRFLPTRCPNMQPIYSIWSITSIMRRFDARSSAPSARAMSRPYCPRSTLSPFNACQQAGQCFVNVSIQEDALFMPNLLFARGKTEFLAAANTDYRCPNIPIPRQDGAIFLLHIRLDRGSAIEVYCRTEKPFWHISGIILAVWKAFHMAYWKYWASRRRKHSCQKE